MGQQSKSIKPRKCDKCGALVETTAKGIQAHSEKCGGAQ